MLSNHRGNHRGNQQCGDHAGDCDPGIGQQQGQAEQHQAIVATGDQHAACTHQKAAGKASCQITRARECGGKGAGGPPAVDGPGQQRGEQGQPHRLARKHAVRRIGKDLSIAPVAQDQHHHHEGNANHHRGLMRRPDMGPHHAVAHRVERRSATPQRVERQRGGQDQNRAAGKHEGTRTSRRRRGGDEPEWQASGEIAQRRGAIGPFARAQPRDRTQHAGTIGKGAEPEQRPAKHSADPDRISGRRHREMARGAREQQAENDPQARFAHRGEPGHAPIAHQFFDSGNHAGAAALNRMAHDRGAKQAGQDGAADDRTVHHCCLPIAC